MMLRYLSTGVAAIVVVGLVATVVSRRDDPPWASFSDPHISWNKRAGTVDISMRVQKRQACARTIIEKTAQRVETDSRVEQHRIVLDNDQLAGQLQELPVGNPPPLFDRATPAQALAPGGHYLVTVTAFCEPIRGVTDTAERELLRAEPLTAIMIVN